MPERNFVLPFGALYVVEQKRKNERFTQYGLTLPMFVCCFCLFIFLLCLFYGFSVTKTAFSKGK